MPLHSSPSTRSASKGRKYLTVRSGKECIGCLDCARACAMAYQKTDDAGKACLSIERTEAGKFSPLTCDQCGKCAEVCPVGAITKNPKGVYMINKKVCIGCGKCKRTCPKGILPKTKDMPAAAKCIACGICVKACPRDVLVIADI